MLVLPSFDRNSSAQSSDSSTSDVSLVLVPDKQVIDITDPTDKIIFTATLTKAGQPLSGYPVVGVSGNELFPDLTGEIPEPKMVTDADGKVTFEYVTRKTSEDVIDVSAVATIAQVSDIGFNPDAGGGNRLAPKLWVGQAFAQASDTGTPPTVASNTTQVIADDPATDYLKQIADALKNTKSESTSGDTNAPSSLTARWEELNDGNGIIHYEAVLNPDDADRVQFPKIVFDNNSYDAGWFSSVSQPIGGSSNVSIHKTGQVQFNFDPNASLHRNITFTVYLGGDNPQANRNVANKFLAIRQASFRVEQRGPTPEELEQQQRISQEGVRFELTASPPNIVNGTNPSPVKISGVLSYDGQPVRGSVTISATGPGSFEGGTYLTVGTSKGTSPASAEFSTIYHPSANQTKDITITAQGKLSEGNAAGYSESKSVEIAVQGATDSGEEGGGDQGEQGDRGGESAEPGDTNDTSGDSQTQTGQILLTVNRSESSSNIDTSMFPLKLSARYNGNPVAVQIKTFGDGQFTTVKSISGADGDYSTTFQPKTKGGLVQLNFEATTTLNGKSLFGEADYSLNTAYDNPLASDRVRKITVNAGATELNPPTRNVGEHTYSGYASDLRGGKSAGRDHFSIIDKLGGEGNGYTSIDVSITGGDGQPVPDAAVEARVTTPGTIAKSGSVACDTSTTSYCPTGGDVYKTITANTNSKGTLTVYFFAGISSRSVTVSFRHRFYSDIEGWTYAETDPTEITFTIKGGSGGVSGGGTGGGSDPGSGSGDDQKETDKSQFSVRVNPTQLTFKITEMQADPSNHKVTVTFHQPAKSEMTPRNENILMGIKVKSGMMKISAGGAAGSRGDFIGKYYKPDKEAKEESYEFTIFYDKNMQSTSTGEIHISVSGRDKNEDLVYGEATTTVNFAAGGTEEQNQAEDLKKIWNAISQPTRGGGTEQRIVTTSFDKSVLENLSRHTEAYTVKITLTIYPGENMSYAVNDGGRKQLVGLFNLHEYSNLKVAVFGDGDVIFSVTAALDLSEPIEKDVNWKQQRTTYTFGYSDEDGESGDDSADTQEFEFDPNAPLQGTNMQTSANDAWNRIKDYSFVSKNDKDKIKAELDKIGNTPGYGEQGLRNVRGIIYRSLQGSGRNPIPSSDPGYKEAYDMLGDLGIDIYTGSIYRNDNKSERAKKYAEQAAAQIKKSNWGALDALKDEMGIYGSPDVAENYYLNAGDYEEANTYSSSGVRQKRDANGKPIPINNNSGDSGSGGSSGGSGDSGLTPGATPALNSFSSLFDIPGTMANAGQAIGATTISLWNIFVNWLANIF